MKKALKIGCFSIVGFFVLVVLYFIFEPESWKNERLNKAKNHVKNATKRMAKLNEALPMIDEETIPKPFPTEPFEWANTLFASVEEIISFKDTAFIAKQNQLTYGPWRSAMLQTIEECYDPTLVHDPFKQIRDGEEVLKRKYIMVYQPVHHLQPRMIDKKTFQPGYFDGWMIYMDIDNVKTLGYARFQSFTTLYKIDGQSLGVGVGPIAIPLINTTNFNDELQKDFENEFFRKTDSTYRAFKNH